MKPLSLIKLIASLNKLPGVSKKQAEKLAYHIISSNNNLSNELIQTLGDAKAKIRLCEQCGHYTEKKVCDICEDKDRQLVLVVVESPLDVFKFEDNGSIRPYYHVLGGLINISKKISFDDLNVKTLPARAKQYKEVILALSPNLEGIVTSNYITQLLNGSGARITQLAQGIPLGAAMEYVDELTLKAALDNRKDVK